MTKPIKVGIRELVRDTSLLDRYDMIEIEDKKSHKLKGVFVSSKYAQAVEHFIAKKQEQEIQEKLDALERFAGSGTGLFGELSIQKIKASMDE